MSRESATRIDGAAAQALLEVAEENRVTVVRAAAQVEDLLICAIVAHFGLGNWDRKVALDVRSFIAETSWCTFDGKRQVVGLILTRLDYQDRKWRKHFDDIIKRAIFFRNAFTHGYFVSDGTEVRLRWFSGEPQEQTLTDEWLTTVESRLEEAKRLGEEIDAFLRRRNPRHNQEIDGSGI